MTMPDLIVNANRLIPAAVRRDVVARDGLICQHCGAAVVRQIAGEPYRPDWMHLDHVIPWAEGGDHTVVNLVVACADCNLGRPKPKRVVRHPTVRVTRANGMYWWKHTYRPPSLLPPAERGWAVTTFQRELGMSPVRVLRLVVAGELAATPSPGRIRVEVPKFVLEQRAYLARMAELRRISRGPDRTAALDAKLEWARSLRKRAR